MYKLLDLFCGAGGCTKGYQEAGFDVDGVDQVRQKRYVGSRFFWADALEFVAEHGHEYDAIHASPPCQGYIKAGIAHFKEHPKLIEPMRDLLVATGKPYVIENVMDAPLADPIILSGTLFGLKVLRLRKFECDFPVDQPIIPEFTGKVVRMGRQPKEGEYITVSGHFTDVKFAREAMGISWMVRDELSQAIPPAYTRYVGGFLARHLDHA